MSIIGRQFDREKVSAQADAALYAMFLSDQSGIILNRGNEMDVSVSGLKLIIDTGMALINGRLVEITARETITVPAQYNGYLCIIINLSQENTSSGTPGTSDYIVQNNQLSIGLVESLTQQDLHNGGLIYTFNLGHVSSNATTATYTKNENLLRGVPWMLKTGTSFNTVTTPGLYTMRTVQSGNSSIIPNAPTSGNYSLIVNKSNTGDYIQQLAIKEGSTQMYIRYGAGSSWGAWQEFSLVGHTHTANDISGTWSISRGGTGATTAGDAANTLRFVQRRTEDIICAVQESGSKSVEVENGWAVLVEGFGGGNKWSATVTTWDDDDVRHGHYVVATVAYSGSIRVKFESAFNGTVRVSYIVWRVVS